MTATKDQLKDTQRHRLPSGVDLMRQITEGSIQKAPNEYLESVKAHVTENCDELIELGARIRPLVVDGEQIGWVRGVHNTEKRRLSRWIHNHNDYLVAVLTLATSLKKEEIEQFSGMEIHNLIELVQKMTTYDVSLYPYLTAFTSTMVSENLWHGRGTQLTSFENKEIVMPDGFTMRIMAPSEHARLWASLCVYREQSKVRMDANWNAVLQVRPLAGKSVDPLANELKALSKQLATDNMESWEQVVRYRPEVKLDDGWAHAENLDTQEGMLKELHGMLNFDKHEQLMAVFEKQQIEAAEAKHRAIKALVPQRELGVNEETMWVATDAEVRQRELDLKKGRVPTPINREVTEVVINPLEKMKRYQ